MILESTNTHNILIGSSLVETGLRVEAVHLSGVEWLLISDSLCVMRQLDLVFLMVVVTQSWVMLNLGLDTNHQQILVLFLQERRALMTRGSDTMDFLGEMCGQPIKKLTVIVHLDMAIHMKQLQLLTMPMKRGGQPRVMILVSPRKGAHGILLFKIMIWSNQYLTFPVLSLDARKTISQLTQEGPSLAMELHLLN
jgi:hypothetical protein